MSFRLRTLGVVSLDGERGPVTGRSTQRRRLALLVLLAAARGRPVSREKLLAYFWPERDGDRGRHALAQALYALRHDLGERAIVGGIDELRLDPAVVTSDVADFQAALEEGEVERGLALYGGSFLDGFHVPDAPEFERWADGERGRLAALHAAALERAGADAARRGELPRAAEWWRRRAALDPLNSRIAVELMRALEEAGDRAGALRHAALHAALLREELGAAPDTAVEELAARLRAPDPDEVPLEPALAAGGARHLVGAAPPLSRTKPVAGGPRSRSTPHRLATEADAAPADNDAALVPAPERPAAAPRRAAAMAAALLLAAAVATVAVLASPLRARRAAADVPRSVVLGTIESPDSTLGLAVSEALRAELEAAPQVRVLTEFQVRDALRLMARSPESAVGGAVAVEIAERRGAPFAVVGSAAPLGSGAQLVVRLIHAPTAAVRATLSERPASAGEVLPAVTRLAAALRERLAAERPTAPAPPLPAVTTSSLEALRSFALARQALARGDRPGAITHLEAALVHDSLFARAHYLLGDLYWYVDRQRRSDYHLARAHQLSERLLPRDRLIVRARYEQIVRDRLDSALAYWRLLRVSFPDEALAHEGMVWVYRALNEPARVAAHADSALRLDPSAVVPNEHHLIVGLLAAGDTLRARAYADSLGAEGEWVRAQLQQRAVLQRGDWTEALRLQRVRNGPQNPAGGYYLQPYLLALGRLAEAERAMEDAIPHPFGQTVPRMLILQARAEAEAGMTAHARRHAWRAMHWLRAADLSPPAYARLAERIADAGARTGDRALIAAARALLAEKDAGRGLPSYQYALQAVDACAAFARGDARGAAALLNRARAGRFFGRSYATLTLLHADALAASGVGARADSLYAALLQIDDSDSESWPPLREIAVRRRRALTR